MPEPGDSSASEAAGTGGRGAAGAASPAPAGTTTEPPLVFALDLWDPGRGGLEAYAALLLAGLAERGVGLVLCCGRARQEPPVPWVELGAEGPAFYAALDERLGFGADGERFDRRRLVAFRHPGPDCRVFLPLGGLLATSLAARRAADPWGLRGARRLARALSPRTRAFLARERAFFTGAGTDTLVVANSELVAAEIARRHPGYRGRVEVLGLPVDERRHDLVDAGTRARSRSAVLGIEDDRPVLLWIGNEPRRKGWRIAAAVHARFRQRRLDALLVCAGRGSEAFDGRAEGIVGLGPVGDPRDLYRAADVLLAPSLEDSFNLVVLEALASGLPVVPSGRCGAAMLVQDPLVGRVVADPRDLDGFDRACLALCERGMLAPERRVLRRRAASPCFLDRHLDRMLALLESATCT